MEKGNIQQGNQGDRARMGYVSAGKYDPILDHTAALDRGHASVANSTFNLANAAIGAGILAFPRAFESTGLLSGIVVTVFLIILSYAGLWVLSQFATRTDFPPSYHELVGRILGPQWGLVCQLVLLFYLIGACVAYLTIIGDTFTPLARLLFPAGSLFVQRKFIIAFLSTLLTFPLTCLKQVKVLGFTSSLAILAAAYTVGFVIYSSAAYIGVHAAYEPSVVQFNPTPDFFFAMPVICFAFQCHVLAVPVYAELRSPTLPRLNKVILVTLAICGVLYTSTAAFGYMQFGTATKADISQNYGEDNVLANIGRLCIGITCIFSYPMVNFTARLALISLAFKGQPTSEMENTRFYGITIGMFIVCMLLALFVPDVGLVFGLVGSLLAVMIMFIMPAAMIHRVGVFGWSKTFSNIVIVVFVVIAILIMVTGTMATILQAIHGK